MASDYWLELYYKEVGSFRSGLWDLGFRIWGLGFRVWVVGIKRFSTKY